MKNLEHIQTFIEVASSGSFAEASRRLAVSTSAVSARVQALEKHLGVRLLNRTTRSVGLTDEGRLYFSRCKEVLDQLLDLEDSLIRPQDLTGRIRISVPLDLPMAPLAALLQAFSARYPKLSVEVHSTDETVDFINSQADVAIRGRAPGSLSLIARKLGDVQLGFFCAASHPARNETPVNWQHYPIADPLNIRPLLTTDLNWRESQLQTHNLTLAKQLCQQGQNLAILPVGFCAAEVAAGTLQALPDPAGLPLLPLFLVYPARKHMPNRVRVFIDFFLQHQQEFPLI
ncbi:LysR family transcriptional regulator [Thalassolituus sp. UBA2009]|uniref:LysR family transcriptional regulator n=1 Tax=Thalassolituus sp. UBA2009 TaxID=1947658 RepID=UPI000C5B6DE0|nr:LysR family transcriptional regulator [Thalassolituus sp. UBA2009]MAY15950.1 LysR family transcriptional regulator [Oceanospirillaceae bacterium]